MSPDVDEPVQLADYDARWASWYEADATEIRRALGPRLRDFLRHHPSVASVYARKKKDAWIGGARRLLAYSSEKAPEMAALLEAAKNWRAG